MRTRTVELNTPAGPMPTFEAKPDATSERGIIVIQEAFGVNDHIRDVANRFAAEGYLAVAPALYHRTGSPELGYEGGLEPVIEHISKVDQATTLEDVDAAIGHLGEAGIGPERIGIVGFCAGGYATFLVAIRRRLGAAVTYYGGGIVKGRFENMPPLIDEVPSLQTPWLGLFGDQDQSIPVDQVEALRARLEQDAAVAWDVVRYPDAGHGFFNDQRARSYHAESAADSWPRTLTWFAEHLDR